MKKKSSSCFFIFAAEEHVAPIDLYSMSDTLYEPTGAEAPKILADGTHSTAYDGYELRSAS